MTDAALLLDAGVLLAPRYPRIIEYARSIDVDPGTLLTVLLGIRPYGPDVLPAPVPDPASVRRRCDRGEATWAQALEEIDVVFPRLCGKEWDAAGYGRFLSSGHGFAVRLDAARVVQDAVSSGCEVLVIATGPKEFAAGMAGLIPEGAHVAFTHELGVARPDPTTWFMAAQAAGLATSPDRWCIVADAWESIDALERSTHPGVDSWDAAASDAWLEGVRARLDLPARLP